ncbi:unnamed protein product [Gadus morhua 'NCC']
MGHSSRPITRLLLQKGGLEQLQRAKPHNDAFRNGENVPDLDPCEERTYEKGAATRLCLSGPDRHLPMSPARLVRLEYSIRALQDLHLAGAQSLLVSFGRCLCFSGSAEIIIALKEYFQNLPRKQGQNLRME